MYLDPTRNSLIANMYGRKKDRKEKSKCFGR